MLRARPLTAAVLLVALGSTAGAPAQEPAAGWEVPPPQQQDETMQRLARHARPGRHHRRLDPLVGRWDQTVRWWSDPGGEPTVSRATAEYRWILGGRFLEGVYRGELMGEPFEGRDLTGYDNTRGEYVNLWIDSTSTSFMTSRGRHDPDTDTLAMRGTLVDPVTGETDKPFRTVMKALSDQQIMFRMYATGPDGREIKIMEIESHRIRDDEP